jgi:hypothetical protein
VGGVVLEREEDEEEATMDRPARPTGVWVVDDNRAVFLCRGLPVESEAAAATAAAVAAIAAPPASPALIVALARPALTTAGFAITVLPAPASCLSTPASSPAWSVEKRRVFMNGLAGWVYCLPPSG